MDATRRPSLLPQRAAGRSDAAQMRSVSEAQPPGPSCQRDFSSIPCRVKTFHNQASSMKDPTDLGRSVSAPKSSMITPFSLPATSDAYRPTTRRSLKNESSRVLDPSRAKSSVSSNRSEASVNTGAATHSRSSSQRVRVSSVTTGAPSLRTLHSRQPSNRISKHPVSTTQQQVLSQSLSISSDAPLPSEPAEGINSSADTFHTQMELARLHLLHQSAASLETQWEQSAKEAFGKRFRELSERHAELKDIAREQQILVNKIALVQWSQGRSGTQITEKVQLVAQNITDVCDLLKTGARYARVLEIFESWFTQALATRGERELKASNLDEPLDFVQRIGDGWKAEAMVMERDITYHLREIRSFGKVRDSSGLGRILYLYDALITGLLDELDVIQWIENDIMSQEESRIGSIVQGLSSDRSHDLGSTASLRAMV